MPPVRKPHKCPKCNLYFRHPSDIKAHDVKHTGEKPYECKLCPNRYGHTASLKSHNNRHTGEKPYKCSRCLKAFPYASTRRNHQRKCAIGTHDGLPTNNGYAGSSACISTDRSLPPASLDHEMSSLATRNRALATPGEQSVANRERNLSNRHSCYASECFTGECSNFAAQIECDDSSCIKDCKNRRIQRMTQAALSIHKDPKKGLGVKAESIIPEGALITEYTGVKVRKESCDWTPYLMDRTDGVWIDAAKSNHISKYFNHSCSPNAAVERWAVDGDLRIVLIAKCDIPMGKEVTFDYRWSDSEQECYCSEANCTGRLDAGRPTTNLVIDTTNVAAI